jgi:hypothetical protein
MVQLLLVLLFTVGCATDSIPKSNGNYKSVDLPYSDFIFLGDTGTGTTSQYQVATGIKRFCNKYDCHFGLLLGDNIYPIGIKTPDDRQMIDKFEKPYKDLSFKFYPVLGNHDHYGSWLSQVKYRSEKWHIPSRFYKLNTLHADLFGIDTQKFGDDQIKWLDQELPKSTKWKIVFGHHPVYSNGAHGDTSYMKKKLLPIMKKHNVDFYLAGHDHNLEIIHRDEMVFAVSGAGAKLRGVDRGGKGSVYIESILGFSYLDMSMDRAIMYMLDKNGVVLHQKKYTK